MNAGQIDVKTPEQIIPVTVAGDCIKIPDFASSFATNSPSDTTADQSAEQPSRVMTESDSLNHGGQSRYRKSRKAGASPRGLGRVLQKRRHELGLTQRQLAALVHVQSAHIAYLEGDRRRPSLSLLNRISDALGLDQRELFALAHPEARPLIRAESRLPTRSTNAAWTEFKRNKALLVRNRVRPRELEILAQVNLLGKVSAPRNFMFILNAIRQAVDEE